jgi:phage tail-like protein
LKQQSKCYSNQALLKTIGPFLQPLLSFTAAVYIIKFNEPCNVKELLTKLYKTTQPSFYFTIQFPDEVIKPDRKPDIVFLEISGMAIEINTETIEEGDLNSNVHTAPKSLKHGNLVMKSGSIARESNLADWCVKTLLGDLSTLIEPRTILVQLKDDKEDLLLMWRINDAYPVKWLVDESNLTNNNILVESIEFAYSFSTRE